MDRNGKRGCLIVIIAFLVILVLLLSAVVGFLVLRNSNFGIDLGINKSYPTVMTRDEENRFTDYNISLIAGEVVIENSEDEQVHYSIEADEKKLTVREEDGTLYIKDRSVTKNWKEQNTSRIRLAVPSDFSGTFTVTSNAGNVTLGSFPAATLTADADAGEIKVGEIGSISASCNAGNIKIDTVNRKAEITANAGNVNIESANLTEGSQITCDFGNIVIRDIGNVKVQAVCEVGKSSVKKNNDASSVILNINADYGNISVG